MTIALRRIGDNGGPPLEEAVSPLALSAPQRIYIGEKFRPLFSSFRMKALYGGRGSAKSHTIGTVLMLLSRMTKAQRMLAGGCCTHVQQQDGLLIVCARQFQSSIRDSVKELIEQKIKAHGFSDEYNITEREIIHKTTGTRFIFIGLDRNPDSAKSLEGADICWVEEARTINSRSFEILVPTIRKPGSEIWWSWNPEFREDPVDKYFRSGKTKPPRSFIQAVGIEDNPYFYTTALAEEMWHMRATNAKRAEHVWDGGYDDAFDTKVFTTVQIGRVDVPAYCRPRYGLDFGFGQDPSFLTKVYIIEERRIIYVAREFQGCIPLKQLPAALRSVLEDESDFIRADSGQPVAIDYLSTEGFNISGAVKGPGSIKAGINWLQGYTIVIDPDCEGMRDEARLYSWQVDKITKKVLNVPVDAHNHGWDSIRYACEDAIRSGDVGDDEDDGSFSVRF
jgi:phage terminase large subunit